MDKDNSYLQSAFMTPHDHVFITADQLESDTQHPELNSTQYFQWALSYKAHKDFLPVFSLIDHSGEFFVLGTNDFTSPIFDGNFIGTKTFDTIAKKSIADVSCLMQQNSTVTGIKFLDQHMFVAATKSCYIKLISIYSKDDNHEFLKYAEQLTDGYVKTIDKFNGSTHLIYGTTKGHISISNFELTDLTPDFHYANVHYGTVSGVSADPHSSDSFVSCSHDHNCLMWDKRNVRPATGLLTKYENQFTAAKWTSQNENQGLVMVADEIGNILTLDVRCPNKILSKVRVSNRPITSLNFKDSKRFGVVSKSNVMSIMEVETDGGLREIYKHTAPGTIYSMSWDVHDSKTFYFVGEDQLAEKVVLME